jgi:hypothetical protein
MSTTATVTEATQQKVVVTTPEGPSSVSNNPNILPAAEDKAFQAVARGDRAGKLKLRGIPTFSDPYAERQWIKEHMAAAFRYFGKEGFNEGISGHISVRGAFIFPFLKLVARPAAAAHRWMLISYRPRVEGPLLDEPLRKTFQRHEGL